MTRHVATKHYKWIPIFDMSGFLKNAFQLIIGITSPHVYRFVDRYAVEY